MIKKIVFVLMIVSANCFAGFNGDGLGNHKAKKNLDLMNFYIKDVAGVWFGSASSPTIIAPNTQSLKLNGFFNVNLTGVSTDNLTIGRTAISTWTHSSLGLGSDIITSPNIDIGQISKLTFTDGTIMTSTAGMTIGDYVKHTEPSSVTFRNSLDFIDFNNNGILFSSYTVGGSVYGQNRIGWLGDLLHLDAWQGFIFEADNSGYDYQFPSLGKFIVGGDITGNGNMTIRSSFTAYGDFSLSSASPSINRHDVGGGSGNKVLVFGSDLLCAPWTAGQSIFNNSPIHLISDKNIYFSNSMGIYPDGELKGGGSLEFRSAVFGRCFYSDPYNFDVRTDVTCSSLTLKTGGIRFVDGTIMTSTAGFGGGGWVGTAESDLNMSTYSILNAGAISFSNGAIISTGTDRHIVIGDRIALCPSSGIVHTAGLSISSFTWNESPHNTIYESGSGDLILNHNSPSSADGTYLAIRTNYAQLVNTGSTPDGALVLDRLDSFSDLDVGGQNATYINIGRTGYPIVAQSSITAKAGLLISAGNLMFPDGTIVNSTTAWASIGSGGSYWVGNATSPLNMDGYYITGVSSISMLMGGNLGGTTTFLVQNGQVGIGNRLFTGRALSVSDIGIGLNDTNQIRLYNSAGANYIDSIADSTPFGAIYMRVRGDKIIVSSYNVQINSPTVVTGGLTASGQVSSNSRKIIDQYDYAVVISSPYSLGLLGSSATCISPFRSFDYTISSITIHCQNGTSVTAMIQQRNVNNPDSAGTNVWTANVTGNTSGWKGGTFADNTVPAGSALYLLPNSVSGNVDYLIIKYTITKD